MTTRGTVINGRDLAVGDVLEFLGRAHKITRIEPYVPGPRFPGSHEVVNLYPKGARIVHDDAANWGMTIEGGSQFFLCDFHQWWTQTGCYKCSEKRR